MVMNEDWISRARRRCSKAVAGGAVHAAKMTIPLGASVLGVADKSTNHRNGGLIETQSTSDIQNQFQPLSIYWLATLKSDLRRSSQVKTLWCLNVCSGIIHSILDTL